MALTLKQAESVLAAFEELDNVLMECGQSEVAADLARAMGLKRDTPRRLRAIADSCDVLALELEEQATLVKEALNEVSGTGEIGEVSND